jgi:hypothetical protein
MSSGEGRDSSTTSVEFKPQLYLARETVELGKHIINTIISRNVHVLTELIMAVVSLVWYIGRYSGRYDRTNNENI